MKGEMQKQKQRKTIMIAPIRVQVQVREAQNLDGSNILADQGDEEKGIM